MIELKYGNIERRLKWNKPTKKIFNSWRKDFFKIEETKKFNVFLVGRFLDVYYNEKSNTSDIDIVLTGNKNIKDIEKVIYEGIKLGIDKYKTFFDIIWFDRSPDFYTTIIDKKYNFRSYVLSNKWIVNGEVKKIYHSANKVSENLWEIYTTYPTKKQLKRMKSTGYKYKKPLIIK